MFKTYTGGTTQMAPVSSPQSSGTDVNAPGGWHPTILYMIGLLIAEMVAVCILTRYVFK
jgi:hypothetical protein